jgi:outer membrane receptor protein involved in Fe transport
VFLGSDDFNTSLKADTTAWGTFLAAAFDPAPGIELTVAGRYAHSNVTLRDRFGDALNGDHNFNRFNPAVELSWKPGFFDRTLTVFGRYGESSRTPSPAELSCADPNTPCRFPNAFTADPPLEQVVAKTFELGATGKLDAAGGALDWAVTGFSARNENDIIFVSAGPVVGSGFFQNAGETKRQGVEASASWILDKLTLSGSYTFVEATFQDPLTLLSPDNPFADADGQIFVQPGDRIPLIPEHSGRLSAGWAVLPWLNVDASLLFSSDRVFRGDEGNDGPKIGGWARLDLGAEAEVGKNARLFVRIENVLDEDYETFGTYGDAASVFLREAPGASDPRFLTPAAPRAVFAGIRVKL